MKTSAGTVDSVLKASAAALAVWALVQAAPSPCLAGPDAEEPISRRLIVPAVTPKAGWPPESAAWHFLSTHAAELGLPADLANLRLAAVRESRLGTHVHYQQCVGEVPLEGAGVAVSVSRKDGAVLRVFNTTHPCPADGPLLKERLGAEEALDAAWGHLRVHGRLTAPLTARLVCVREADGLRLAYKTLVAVTAPFGDWELSIDAVSGEILRVRDAAIDRSKGLAVLPRFDAYEGAVTDRRQEVARFGAEQARKQAEGPKLPTTGEAWVFDPDPRTTLLTESLTDTSPAGDFVAAYFTRTLRDISLKGGTYSLDGPWVAIADFEPPNTPPSTTTNGVWHFSRGHNGFNDAMTYFHIDQNQRYIQSLGYTGPRGIQAAPIMADSDGNDGDDNSHYTPGLNRLAYGHGGVDDNEDPDVILHEYWHALQHDINPSWGLGDTGAMGEGFGDTWAASYSMRTAGGPFFHPEWAFTWDGHNGFWPGRFLDRLTYQYDPSRTYPAHTTVNGINGDELWGTAVFQAHYELMNMGRPLEDMDTILLESQFGLGSGVTMREMAAVIVQTATNLFPSGPHGTVYRDRFMSHGILRPPSASVPQLFYPADGAKVDNGREDGQDKMIWDFDWSDVPGAGAYQLIVLHAGDPSPFIDASALPTSRYHYVSETNIPGSALSDWTWKVRAKVGGTWTAWSDVRRFSVEPGNSDPALPAELISVSVRREGDAVGVLWQTASETGNRGWNVWRRGVQDADPWKKVNEGMIPGAGTAPYGSTYRFTDGTAGSQDSCAYRLELLSEGGKSQFSPELAVGQRIGAPQPALREAPAFRKSSLAPSKAAAGPPRLPPATDYLIVAPAEWQDAVRPLAECRRSQGRRVGVAAVESILAAAPGLSGDAAIREFLARVWRSEQPPSLRTVLLVGDAIVGPDGEQASAKGLVPTCVRKVDGVGTLATDYPYACVTGDGDVPAFAVGRIPSRSAAEVAAIGRKIVRHETTAPSREAAFVNGALLKGEELAEASSEAVIRAFCQDLTVRRIYLAPLEPALEPYRGGQGDLEALWTRGCGWMEFRGHGAGSLWAGVKSAEGARAGRTDGPVPLVISVSCYDGSFADSQDRISLCEALVRNPEGGAVACAGNSGGGFVGAGFRFSLEVWKQIRGGAATFGDAVFGAKRAMARGPSPNRGFLYSVNILGDPASSIKLDLGSGRPNP